MFGIFLHMRLFSSLWCHAGKGKKDKKICRNEANDQS